jgi:SlyX protein
VTDTSHLEQLLQDLQAQFAFQEDTVASLNEALASQQKEILALREELKLLKQRLKEQGDALADMSGSPTDERPPHY